VGEVSVRPDDLALVRRGDDAALGRVVREYSSLVYSVALRITGSEADATDVLQEVFVHLPESLRSFDGGNFAGWLKVVASRRALMLLRSERRQARYYTVTGHVSSWEDQALSRMALERALTGLDPVLRAVFVMKEIEGLTHREIGDAMNISENLSQVRLHRARRALQELLLSP
jgi:RNA polymerase sigma-70 factor (ECF subfamily)